MHGLRRTSREERAMSHDDFESERYRVERVIEILERAATRLESGGAVSLSMLTDAVTFIHRSEETAYEAMLDEDEPALSRCLEQHTAVREPLATMQDSLAALARGDATVAGRFARAVAEYVKLRREHLAADDRLFARAARRVAPVEQAEIPVELVESPDTRRLYDRVVEAGSLLDMGIATAFPNVQGRRSTPV
jgi:hemerythrin-like domain-containing protein